MVVGTTLFNLDGNPYYSPMFPRGGEAATFVIDVTHVSGTPSLTFEVQHKNADETTWAMAGSITSIATTGVNSVDLTGIKEQVRLKYTPGGASATSAVHFVVPAPAWRPY